MHRMRKVVLRMCVGVAVAAAGMPVGAQVNILSDVINFRTSSDEDEKTIHHGQFDSRAQLGWYECALKGENTSYSNAQAFGVYGRSTNAPGYGYGGYFAGGNKGIAGFATSSGTGYRYGGYFAANNADYEYALYATTYGGSHTNNSWAGWFDGDVRVTTVQSPSDRKLKKDIADYAGGLEKVMKLKPKTYRYRLEEYSNMSLPEGECVGLVAQDVEAVMPSLVTDATLPPAEADPENGEGLVRREAEPEPEVVKHLNTLALVPVLISAIQEQQKEIEQLKFLLQSR